jgi:hypothetical protein
MSQDFYMRKKQPDYGTRKNQSQEFTFVEFIKE